ncbi:Protein of unknown function [Streptococcus thermophilus]|nr:Protein of unknown function [Streptococcus thermophilus]
MKITYQDILISFLVVNVKGLVLRVL